jgi:uncharacterized membrane protein
MKRWLKVLEILFMLLVLSAAVLAQNTTPRNRTFRGTANISVIEPTDTVLKICTPNEKYRMEPGQEGLMRLYVRNDMKNKTVSKVYLEVAPVNGFIFSFAPDHLENLTPDSHQYFDIAVKVEEGVAYGNYRVDFLLGTDEYMVGSLSDEAMIMVRSYGDELPYILGAVVVIILLVAASRLVWIIKVNRKAQQEHRASKHRRKAVSQQYYKKDKR